MIDLQRIHDFVAHWTDKGYEKDESQPFWIDLLLALGVSAPAQYIRFEDQVHLDHTAFIDGYIPSTHVLIEQKSITKDLGAPIRQSDGSQLNPFQQAKRYAAELPYSQRPRWIVTCNFREFWIYDMEQPNAEPTKVLLENLEKEHYLLGFLVKKQDEHLQREMELSMQAGELVGQIYDKLILQYHDPTHPESLRSLNQLCVRLVFLLFAEDAELFGDHNAFHDYMSAYPANHWRRALIDLFRVLDTPIAERDPYLDDDLKGFPYVNGGLFSDSNIEIPQFTEELKQLILTKASADFDWSEISPTIFGGVFESTLNPETRRSGGMHYTSIENIHKVIDPLFMHQLEHEYERCTTKRDLQALQNKLASLTFFDPACGSGNFLTETYISLRRLENKIIARLQGGQVVIGEFLNPIKVDIHQFYGIEINDFAVSVATTALWIAELQMLRETRKIAQFSDTPLPLKTYHNIHEGNALRMDWAAVLAGSTADTLTGDALTGDAGVSPAGKAQALEDTTLPTQAVRSELPAGETPASPVIPAGETPASPVIPAGETPASPVQPASPVIPSPLYIIGNPPFIGARMKSQEQAEDMLALFGKDWKNIGNLDYVGGWYLKAARLMQADPTVRAALVSTNSITQGEQVAILWQPLFEQYGIHFDFAYPTFRWDSESSLKAHVHCVILGFSRADNPAPKRLYRADGTYQACQNINGYLVDAPSVFINSRSKPLCNVPEIGIGNKPIDGGNYLFLPDEKEEFIRKEPKSAQYFRPWYGSDEFINNRPRFCLWLGGCSPAELRSMPECLKRVENVRNFRLASKSEGTRKIADKPTRFHVENMPSGSYIIIPRVSSERRRYIPMGYLTPDCLTSDSAHIIPNATLYHFGVLTSNVHMAWMRAVCGRLEMRYRYSKDIVYNNFPWPFQGGAALTGDALTGDAGVPPAGSSVRTGYACNVVSSKACALPAGETPAPPVPPAGSSVRTGYACNVVSAKACALPAGETPASPVEPTSPVKASPILDHCRKYLPHIENKQVQAITFRLYDSLPQEVLQQYKNRLVNAGENSQTQQIRQLVEQYEDTGYGQCFLKDTRIAQIVQDALKFNHGKQYKLISWSIMPNHVHVLIEVLSGYSLSTILHTWRSYTAHEANKVLQRTGDFWMEEYYDRYIRDINHFNNAVRYIENNAVNAGLVRSAADYAYCSVGDGWYTTTGDAGVTGGAVTGDAGVPPAGSSVRTGYTCNVVSSKACALPAGETPAPPVITAGETPAPPEMPAGETPASPVNASPVNAMVAKIMQTAQGILDARALYPDCSLADLYDEVTMPIELRRAHQANDRAVMQAYGFPIGMSESECVARLLEMYQALV